MLNNPAYIRLNKTGSSSISTTLPNSVSEVMPIDTHKIMVDNGSYDYFFTFVRNPYDRIVSAFHSLVKDTNNKPMHAGLRINEKTSFKDFILTIKDYRESWRYHRKTELDIRWFSGLTEVSNNYSFQMFWLLSHTEPMTQSIEFIKPISDLDFIGKFENLSEDYTKIKKTLKFDGTLPHLQKSFGRIGYKNYYDSITYDLVTEMFKNDIDNFSYEF